MGDFKQKPGCPTWTAGGIGAERLDHLCQGECYNPTDERLRITRIEVVRIRPQQAPGENVTSLIDNPWRTFKCQDDPAGCIVEFEEEYFIIDKRPAVYCVRAIQEPEKAINARGPRCTRGSKVTCISVNPCWGNYRTPMSDDWLASSEERACATPICVDPKPCTTTRDTSATSGSAQRRSASIQNHADECGRCVVPQSCARRRAA